MRKNKMSQCLMGLAATLAVGAMSTSALALNEDSGAVWSITRSLQNKGDGRISQIQLINLDGTLVDPAYQSNITLYSDGEIVGNGANGVGLAVNPVDGQMYALLRRQSANRVLATIDPLTGIANQIGWTGRGTTDITFGPDGTLYGITGNNGAGQRSIFRFTDLATLPDVPTIHLPQELITNDLPGGAGHSLAFNTVNGTLLSAHGDPDTGGYREIDPVTGDILAHGKPFGSTQGQETLSLLYAPGAAEGSVDGTLGRVYLTTLRTITNGNGDPRIIRADISNEQPATDDEPASYFVDTFDLGLTEGHISGGLAWGDAALLANTTNGILGDVNQDGTVDLGDYHAWNNNVGTSLLGLTGFERLEAGDANLDGTVDLLDFHAIKDNLAPGVSIPEPSTMALIALSGVVAMRRRK